GLHRCPRRGRLPAHDPDRPHHPGEGLGGRLRRAGPRQARRSPGRHRRQERVQGQLPGRAGVQRVVRALADHNDADQDHEKRMRRGARRLELVAAALGLSLALSGCAAHSAYRKGQREARKGNWDAAVAKLTLALEKDPENIPYKMALEHARIQASRYHYDLGRKAMAAQELDKAADALEIAAKYDAANKSASDDLAVVENKIGKREEEKHRLSEFEAMKNRVQTARLPIPVLAARSPVPITLKFTETSLQKIFDTLAKLAGVNILFDEGFRDKKVDVNL